MKRLAVVLALCMVVPTIVFAQDFFQLVKTGTPDQIAAALANGAKVGARNAENATPLMLAARANENPEVISVLLEAGAKVDDADWFRQTPLIYAAANKNPQVVSILIKAGAKVDDRDEKGVTPLIKAAGFNSNPEVITTLVTAGAKVDDVDINGLTSLMFAAWINKNPEVVMVLLNAGADGKLKSSKGKTAFDYASSNMKLKGTDAYAALDKARF